MIAATLTMLWGCSSSDDDDNNGGGNNDGGIHGVKVETAPNWTFVPGDIEGDIQGKPDWQEVDFYDRHRVPCALMMLSDQTPSNTHRCYWTMFLHQETPFLYGAEYFARKYNYPVLYYRVDKVRRGRYTVTFTPLCENPLEVPQYWIVDKYVRMLEADICRKPEYWLWSHRRWKHQRPEDVEMSRVAES